MLIAGFLGFNLFTYDRAFQSAIIISSAGGYVVWGIIHHHIHKDLHMSIVLEYVAVATLGIVIIFTLLFRA